MKNVSNFLAFIIVIILFSCSPSIIDDDKAVIITTESQGVSSKAVLQFIEAAETQRKDELHSIMILRHDKLIAQGWWNPYNPESPHQLFSLSKSFASSAIGIAQDEGLLNIDDKVISFFPDDLPDSISTNLNSMRIRDLLKMNTGHNNDATGRMTTSGENWVKGFLALQVEHKPGTHFVYNSAATYMLSAIIQKVTGETLTQYLTPRLFEPLGISNPKWDSDPAGINIGGWGLNVRTKDIASLGQLYLHKGNWEGKQLISEEWVDEATSFQTSNGSNPESDWEQGYGYQFWQCRHNIYRGDGAFGQYCIVLPQQDAVIAITSGSNDMQAILNLVWDYLLPGFESMPLAEDDQAFQALQEKLSSLTLSTIHGEASSSIETEISNKKYIMETNEAGIESIAFELDSEDKSITIGTQAESIKIPIGYEITKKSSLTLPQLGEQVVATTGAWRSNNNYELKMYLYETPFYLTFEFLFEDKILNVNSSRNISFGPTGYLQMKGVRN